MRSLDLRAGEKISIVLTVVGIVLVVLSDILHGVQHVGLLLGGFALLLVSVLAFLLNPRNYPSSISALCYAVVAGGAFYAAFSGSAFAIFHGWYALTVQVLLPVVFSVVGLLIAEGTLIERLKKSLSYFFCLAALTVMHYAIIGALAGGV